MEIADIIIVLVNIQEEDLFAVGVEMENTPLKFITMDERMFDCGNNAVFLLEHVPKTAMGRLALVEVLPEQYQDIVYLDGDTYISGDIFDLVNHSVKPGNIAAANDFIWLCENNFGVFWNKQADYLNKLNVSDPKDYYNSGVLAFRRDSWVKISRAAIDYFIRNSTHCLNLDQSALNAVTQGKREVIPPQFNFTTDLERLSLRHELSPNIIHFTGGGKPWRFFGPPWHEEFLADYLAFAERYPAVSKFYERPDNDGLQYVTHQIKLREFSEHLLLSWRRIRRRKLMRDYVARTSFAI